MAKETRAKDRFPQHAKIAEVEPVAKFILWAIAENRMVITTPGDTQAALIRDYIALDAFAFAQEEAELRRIVEGGSLCRREASDVN